MTLRARFASAVLERVKAHAPGATETVWDVSAIMCVIESLKFTACDDCLNDYQMLGGFEGVLRVELHADQIDTINFMPMVADLLQNPVTLPNILSDEIGQCEMARAVLIEQRDAVRNVNEVLAAFRFEVVGSIIRRLDASGTPNVFVSAAPNIGEEFRASYVQVGGEADE